MQEFDEKVRSCVRRILELKDSVPDSYIHTRVADVVLGIRRIFDYVNKFRFTRRWRLQGKRYAAGHGGLKRSDKVFTK